MLMILFKICGFTIFRIKILWVHKFLKLHLWIHKKLNDCLFFKKKENRGNSRIFFLKFDKPLKFSSDFDDLSNGASIAKHNTIPMFFYVFRFPIESIF